MAQKNQQMATRLAACRAGGTKTAFSFSLLSASPVLEGCTAQGLTSELQSNKTCLRITQEPRIWSWIDPETCHLETISHVPLKPPLEVHGTSSPVTSKGSCFIFELALLPFPSSPSKSPIYHLISLSHTYVDFPFLGKTKTKTKNL